MSQLIQPRTLSGFRDYPPALMIPRERMLEQARGRQPWWRSLPGLRAPLSHVCGDVERLPFATASIDMVWSNLALQWVNDLPATFKEIHRALKPGGLLMFSTFGPDTLKELREAYAGSGYTHVNRFIDMHDIGDMLTAARYADPVIDMEPFTLTYDTVRQLMHDLKSIGAHNVTGGRPQALSGKGLLRAVTAGYERFRRDGKLPATRQRRINEAIQLLEQGRRLGLR